MSKIPILKVVFATFLVSLLFACKEKKIPSSIGQNTQLHSGLKYAKGFSIQKTSDITILKVNSPWPNATKPYTYALVPKEKLATITWNKEAYDAVVGVPIEKLVVTSTTHIPALEALNVEDKLVGFPDTKYVSSKRTRTLIESGHIVELGNNESLNTEMVIELNPELVVGFGVSGQTRAYQTLQRSYVPVVYNGDWTEEVPLGKAEWIKFFALFFQKEVEAEIIFTKIEKDYLEAKKLAEKAVQSPEVFSGAMYKDVWYLPGGKSWAAHFLKDANANYLWSDDEETGSLSLGWETVLQKAKNADYWIGPSQFTSYKNMQEASAHYQQFDAFLQKRVYTFANTKGTTGGLLYYELAPQRPDLVLKDLIHILHPSLLPNYEPLFFTSLKE
jgi:iron complex transport system substrate-binding protein